MLIFFKKNTKILLLLSLFTFLSNQVFTQETFSEDISKLDKKNITKLFSIFDLEKELNLETLSSISCSYTYGKSLHTSIHSKTNQKQIIAKAQLKDFYGEGILEIRSRKISQICTFHYSKQQKKFISLPLYPYDWIQKLAFRYYHIYIPKFSEPLNLYLFFNQDVPHNYSIWLYSPSKFLDEQRSRNFFFGVYYGSIIVFLIFTIVLFLTTLEPSQLYYFFLIIGLVFTDSFFSGNLKLVLGDFIKTNAFFDRFILVTTQVFTLLILNEILKNFLNEKKINIVLQNFIILLIISVLITIFIPEKVFLSFFYLTSLLVIFLIFLMFIQAVTSKEIISVIILLSFLVIILTSFINILVALSIFPEKFFIQDNIKLGTLALIFVHSFLLSYKTYITQKKLLEASYILEKRIKERTVELTKTIEELKERDSNFQAELNLASELQKSLFPNQSQTYPLVQFKIFQKGLFQVVGDFFDVFNHTDGSVSFFIADASGHGISAALLTTLSKITIRDTIMKIPEPKEALKEINQRLLNVLKTHDYITLFLFTLFPDGKLKYANAGHNSVFLYRRESEKLEIITSKGIFLGIQTKDFYFEQKETQIHKGDRILLYTDGFTASIKRKKLSQQMENLKSIFLNNQKESLDESFEKIIDEWNAINTETKEDDITFVMLEYTGTK